MATNFADWGQLNSPLIHTRSISKGYFLKIIILLI